MLKSYTTYQEETGDTHSTENVADKLLVSGIPAPADSNQLPNLTQKNSMCFKALQKKEWKVNYQN